MATKFGPNIIKDGLVLSLNAGSERSVAGANLIKGTGAPYLSTSGWNQNGWSGSVAFDSSENALQLTETNGWHDMNYDFGVLNQPVTVMFEYKLKSQQTTGIYGYVLNGTSLGNYVTSFGNIYPSLATYQTFTATFTPTTDSKIVIGLRGTDSGGLTDVMFIKNLRVMIGASPERWTPSMYDNGGLFIDLTRKSNSWAIPAGMFFSDNSINYKAGYSQLNTDSDWITNIKELTIECVFNPVNPYTGCCDTIFGTYWFRFFQIGTQFYTMIGFSNAGVYVTYQHPAYYLTLNNFHHVVGMRRNDRYIIWINGVEVYNSDFGSGYDLWALNGSGINDWYISSSNHPHIKVAEARIYNRGLSDAEILQNFNSIKRRFNL